MLAEQISFQFYSYFSSKPFYIGMKLPHFALWWPGVDFWYFSLIPHCCSEKSVDNCHFLWTETFCCQPFTEQNYSGHGIHSSALQANIQKEIYGCMKGINCIRKLETAKSVDEGCASPDFWLRRCKFSIWNLKTKHKARSRSSMLSIMEWFLSKGDEYKGFALGIHTCKYIPKHRHVSREVSF